MKQEKNRFWETKSLKDLSHDEWEALCDGCGLCCIHRLICDDDSIVETNVACRYFDLECGNCRDYENRFKNVPECVKLTPEKASEFDWLPKTCAYRLRLHNQPLPSWHYLVCGDKNMVRNFGVNSSKYITETDDINIEEHIID